MDYQLYIDHKTINQHVDFLISSEIQEYRKNAIEMVCKKQTLSYKMNQRTEITIPKYD